jgi:putative glutamine amidotransferase
MTRNRIVIGVSRLSANYANWLNKLNSGLEIVDFYTLGLTEVADRFSSISGLLLTGGGDIDPALYGSQELLRYCRDIDQRRDKLETILIELAFSLKVPVLGICRGQQMLNVARKGTLYADLPVFFKGNIIHQGKEDVYHKVSVKAGSLLQRLTGTSEETVNSSHHQAVHQVAAEFTASAFSEDGLTEAIEIQESGGYPFCLAVQWHPERMDFENPLSGQLGKGFLEVVINNR